ncbi:MAG: hypothetical protein ACYS0F_20070, partial [Planctomycetota bacterium]
MKLPAVLLLNLVTVVLALVIYDQVRDESSSGAQDRASRTRADGSADVERRLLALETRVGSSPDSKLAIFERLNALETAREEQAPRADGAPLIEATAIERAAPAATQKPSEADVDRFLQLRDAARRRDSIKKNWDRIEKALGRVSLNLTPKQRTQVHAAYAEFQPRVNQIWTEVKQEARATIEAGGEIDREGIYTSAMNQIQQEFAASLSG